MNTKYYLNSAEEINAELLNKIKAKYKSKPISITVEEMPESYQLTSDMKAILDERLHEDEQTYLSGEESIKKLQKKYGV